jgi:uncharacterized protein involved in exopolysaccharide biosynthesis
MKPMDSPETYSDELRLLEWANVLLSHRALIAFLTLASAAIAFGLCRMVRPLYTAETSLVSNRDAETLTLENLVGLKLERASSSMLDVFSTSFVSSYYMELLRSDILLRPLVGKTWSNGQSLTTMLEIKGDTTGSVERKTLTALRKRMLRIRQDKSTGLLTVECTTPDPVVSAEIAATLVEGLKSNLSTRRGKDTSDLLRSAEEATSKGKTALDTAVKNLKDFRDRNRTRDSAELKSQEEQLQREVKTCEETFNKLYSAVAILRLGEKGKKGVELVNVIQPAEVPLKKSWPPTRNATAGCALFGFLLGVTIAFVRHGIRGLAEREAPGYWEFARHIRSLNHWLPGVILLLPKGMRKKPVAAVQNPSRESDSPEREIQH